MKDLAVERCDGLGWGFGLAFLIHAAAPGVAATVLALQFGKENAIPLAAASAIAYFPIWLVLRGALRKKARIERLRGVITNGTRAWADIALAEPMMGSTKSGGRRYRKAHVFLKVEVPGFMPHDVETRDWYPSSDIQRLTPGTRVPVVVAPDNPNEVVIFEVPATPIWAPSSPMQGFGGVAHGGYPGQLPPQIAEAIATTQRKRLGWLILAALAMTVGLPLVFILAFSAAGDEAKVVDKFFSRLDKENYEGAYDLLSEELQEEVGSPEALGKAWESAGVSVKSTSFTCSSGGFGKWRLGRNATTSGSGSFSIGTLRNTKCRGAVTADLEERDKKPKIVAIRVR
ncbi:MAG: hypothetical protein HOV80_23070 [Polyangiaceae bacterium]|nr:hypothetical protein [Polyangiaceae bacterium]